MMEHSMVMKNHATVVHIVNAKTSGSLNSSGTGISGMVFLAIGFWRKYQ
jgi:hypothetical protein